MQQPLGSAKALKNEVIIFNFMFQEDPLKISKK